MSPCPQGKHRLSQLLNVWIQQQAEVSKEDMPKTGIKRNLSVCPFPFQFGLPLCTWPFCFSALLFLLVNSDNPAIYKIPLSEVTYPEANRIHYLRMKRRASESRRQEQKPSSNSKINTGGTPLCTPKTRHASWFQMSASAQFWGGFSDASQAHHCHKHQPWQQLAG